MADENQNLRAQQERAQREQTEHILKEAQLEEIAKKAEETSSADDTDEGDSKTKEQQQNRREQNAYENATSYHMVAPLQYLDNPGLFLMAMHFKYAQFDKDKKAYTIKQAVLKAAKGNKFVEPGERGSIEAGNDNTNHPSPMNLSGEPDHKIPVTLAVAQGENIDPDEALKAVRAAGRRLGISEENVQISDSGSEISIRGIAPSQISLIASDPAVARMLGPIEAAPHEVDGNNIEDINRGLEIASQARGARPQLNMNNANH